MIVKDYVRFKSRINIFVNDNFYKMILGWSIALTKDAKNVKAALQQTSKTIHRYHPKHITTTLVADGNFG